MQFDCRPPSVFDSVGQPLIHAIRFLTEFATDISSPITRNTKEHIEYVPTQIVTEYFRKVFRFNEDDQFDGLAYRSSKNPDGLAFVLFCENTQIINLDDSSGPNHLLRLVKVDHK